MSACFLFKNELLRKAKAWEQRKLGDVAEYAASTHTASTLVESEVHGSYSIFDATNEIAKLDTFDQETTYISIIKDGAGVGRTCLRPKNTSVISTMGYILGSQVNINFLFQYLQNIRWEKYIIGSTIPHVYFRDYKEEQVYIPSAKEQQTIASLFSRIDSLITLQQRKCDLLKEHKKTLLSKMFPKNGSVFPEFRFSGFTDAWEQRKLGDIANSIIAGGDVDKTILKTKGLYPVIANSLVKDGIIGYYQDNFRIEAPAITITGRGDIGHATARNTNFTPVVRLISVKSKHDIYFLENAVNKTRIFVESTGVPQLTVPQVKEITLSFPESIDEEKQIGGALKTIGRLITLQQRKLDSLKTMKQSLLKAMFI